jgi:myosin heavy subunit
VVLAKIDFLSGVLEVFLIPEGPARFARSTRQKLKPTRQKLELTRQKLKRTRQKLKPTRQKLKPTRQKLNPTRQNIKSTPQRHKRTRQRLKPIRQKLKPTRQNSNSPIRPKKFKLFDPAVKTRNHPSNSNPPVDNLNPPVKNSNSPIRSQRLKFADPAKNTKLPTKQQLPAIGFEPATDSIALLTQRAHANFCRSGFFRCFHTKNLIKVNTFKRL